MTDERLDKIIEIIVSGIFVFIVHLFKACIIALTAMMFEVVLAKFTNSQPGFPFILTWFILCMLDDQYQIFEKFKRKTKRKS